MVCGRVALSSASVFTWPLPPSLVCLRTLDTSFRVHPKPRMTTSRPDPSRNHTEDLFLKRGPMDRGLGGQDADLALGETTVRATAPAPRELPLPCRTRPAGPVRSPRHTPQSGHPLSAPASHPGPRVAARMGVLRVGDGLTFSLGPLGSPSLGVNDKTHPTPGTWLPCCRRLPADSSGLCSAPSSERPAPAAVWGQRHRPLLPAP